MDDIRQTYETAHKVIVSIDETMRAFEGFLDRIRNPGRLAVPSYCQTPSVLWDHWKKLRALEEALDMCYLYDPASEADILRALATCPPVHDILNVTARTHVEATYLIGNRIWGRLSWVCQTMANSYNVIDESPQFSDDCEEAAKELRDYMPRGSNASKSLAYLRKAVAREEIVCDEFFNPPMFKEPQRDENAPMKGVTLRDAAILLNDGDGKLATLTTEKWRNSRSPKLPLSIGKCPKHSQSDLFLLPDLLEFLKIMEPGKITSDFIRDLSNKLRQPRNNPTKTDCKPTAPTAKTRLKKTHKPRKS